MKHWKFKSLVLCNEINLNIIASHFGINKKFRWEDPLVLSNAKLKGILKDETDKIAYIYHFGTIVFINMEHHEIHDLINYIKNIDPNFKNDIPNNLVDEYKLEIDPSYEYNLFNSLMTAKEFKPYYLDIISLILAKSTALNKVEVDIDKLLDSIENIINYLETGKFNMSDKEISKISAKVLRFKYNTMSYLMVLDKPEAAWTNKEIEDFFADFSSLFEIADRYKKISNKTEILQDITEVFTSLTHEKRGTKLEIMVIVLICFELIVSIIEFILKMH